MFAPPAVIETEIFAELPARFRQLRSSVFGEVNRGGQPLHSYLEGPSFDRDGNLYVVDIPFGRVFRVSPGGVFALVAEYDGEPNGLVMNVEENALFVAVTRGNCIWRLPILPDGSTTKVGLFIQLSGGPGGPDGLALDESGNLAVAHLGLGCVWLFDRHGQPLYRVQSCAGRHATNMAYGGPDGRTLFITESESGTILRAAMPVAGKAMFSHQP